MSEVIDIRTLVLIHVGISITQAIVLLYLWSAQRSYPPAKDWAIGSLLFATGLFLFALRQLAPPLLTEVVSNLFLLPGLMLFNFGIIEATGRRPPVGWGLLLCALANVALAWVSIGDPNYPAGVLIQNAVFLIFDFYVAFACLTAETRKGNHTFRVIGILFLVLITACSWRVVGGLFGQTLSVSSTLPRLIWIATSLLVLPMITVLLTLHTSQRLQEEIHDQARRDTLTGAYNRRAFEEFGIREWARSLRHGCPLSLLTVDIDHFKNFNDQHGHQTGDAALIQVSRAAHAALRTNDIWCRYGGEEFIALLPGTPLTQAIVVAERLRKAVETTKIVAANESLSVSVSIGVAARTPSHSSLSELLSMSDAALYRAKADGRNRVASGQV